MKTKILFFAFFLFQTITIFAQDMASLKTEALKSYKASVNMNFDAIFESWWLFYYTGISFFVDFHGNISIRSKQ